MNDLEAKQIYQALTTDAQRRTSLENVRDVMEAIKKIPFQQSELKTVLEEGIPHYPPKSDGDWDHYRFVKDNPLNALVVRNQNGNLDIWPKGGGWMNAYPIFGDLAPFAG